MKIVFQLIGFVSCFLISFTSLSIAKDIPFMNNKKIQKNRLAQEKSPYLLQHADNPVDWFPWGEDAFAKAVAEDKPIFLSIGYSTCHWCHVMEHESFEDPIVAERINKYFVPIKVDREERPDIDSIYMTAVISMTGRGGWPLTVFLTPDKKPFFGGTYFPAYPKWNTPGLMDILESIHDSWTTQKERVVQSADSVSGILIKNAPKGENKQDMPTTIFTEAFAQYQSSYDKKNGGFGQSPKFPTSHNLSLLLRYWNRTQNKEALSMVETTLKRMAEGGMYDHVGGGFHRYSTDAEWQIPHFEKMLYDQALLAKTYLEAFQITKNIFYKNITDEILNYVLRDMQSSLGGFYSAEDADTLDPYLFMDMSPDPNQKHEKKEGSFYLWKKSHVQELLGSEDAEVFLFYSGFETDGNAKEDPHNEFAGRNVVYVENEIEKVAKKFDRSVTEVQAVIEKGKTKLFEARATRPRPHLDDKILTDWNGLMISSLALAGGTLKNPEYITAAQKSADFILKTLVDDQGRLLHRYRDGDAGILGTLEDYAFFINGLIDVYEVTFEWKYLKEAHRLSVDMLDLFWDEELGGFFFTGDDGESLLFRQKEIYDGAIPSGNSMAALVMARLSHFTLNAKWENHLQILFRSFAQEIQSRPSAYSQMLIAYDFVMGPSQEIVVSVDQISTDVQEIQNEVYSHFLPNKVVLYRNDKSSKWDEVLEFSPFIENQIALDGEVTVYVCEDHVCKLPVKHLNKLRNVLNQL